MSRYRPPSAFVLLILCAIGCDATSPLRMFRRTDQAAASLLPTDEAEDPNLPSIDATVARRIDDTVVGGSDATTGDTAMSASADHEASSGEPTSSNAIYLTDNQPTASPETVQTSMDATAAQPAAASGLADAAKNALDSFRFVLPGSAKAKEAALAEEIAAFEQFPLAFELPTVAGETVNSAQFSGNLMVVDVWATWCAPCKRAIPEFVALQQEHESRGIQVIGITCDSADPEQAAETARKAFAIGKQLNVNYPLLVDDGTTTKKIPGFRGYPTTLFVSPDGIVRYMVTGAQSEEKLAMMVELIMRN
jgi:thiol-disulfide isomerase/thioredoxin